MKRGKPLARRTPLRVRQALARRSRLSRVTALGVAAVGRPGRPKVTREERHARKLLRARSGGLCEVCQREPATDAHHRQNRSQGGRWEITNLLHLCRREHQHITVSPAVSYERGWSVRSTDDPAAVPVFLAEHGWVYLTATGGHIPIERKAA